MWIVTYPARVGALDTSDDRWNKISAQRIGMIMANHVRAWIDEWTRSNVLSEGRSLSESDELVRKCIEDGATEEFPEDTL